MENKSIVVLVVEPEKQPVLKVLDGSLESMQDVVGGYIEMCMPFEDEVAIICNEEGKFCGLPLNRALYDEEGEMADILAGTFFICYAPADSENFLSLPEELIHKYAEMFETPESFYRGPNGLFVIKEPFLYAEYLGVNYQFHEHEDAVDIEFFIYTGKGFDFEDIDWHTVLKDSDEYKNIEAVAKEWAGNLSIGRANAVLGALKGEPTLTEEGQRLYDIFKSEFLDNGDMYNGCIPYNSCLVDGFKMSVFEELVDAGLIQRRECEGVAYELTSVVREKLLSGKPKSVDELVGEAQDKANELNGEDNSNVEVGYEKE